MRSAALYSGEQINFETWASDALVPSRTVREYFYVLTDTLVGELLEPWKHGAKRKPASVGKFYFFDNGVRNALAGIRSLAPGNHEYGKALEHLVYHELRAWLDYTHDDRPLCFWRTTDGKEVDFILGDECAIEVKAAEIPSRRDLKGLAAVIEEVTFKHRYLLCQAPESNIAEGVKILPLSEFLARL